MNYSIKSKKLLVIINAFNQWRAELVYLLKFKVITD